MGNADNLACFSDRSLVIIDQVDDFALSWRQLIYACAQNGIRLFTIKRHFRRVCGIDDSNHIVLINILIRSPS